MVLAALGERDTAVWKACQRLLAERGGYRGCLEPNGAIRAARQARLAIGRGCPGGQIEVSRDRDLGSRRARSAREHPPPGWGGRGRRDVAARRRLG